MALKILTETKSFPNRGEKTIKYLMQTDDNQLFENVLIFEETVTLCVSSQVGCCVGCKFCSTGSGGFERNLTAEEIVEQVRVVENHSGLKVEYVSYMGMGEPLLNIDNVIDSMKRIGKKYKLSTTMIPGMLSKLKESDIPVELYFSLHASSESMRRGLIPLSKRHDLDKILEEINDYCEKRGPVTIWYLLLEGVNDSKEDAKRLVEVLRGFSNIKLVYLKDYCETETGFKRSPESNVNHFKKVLEKSEIPYRYSVSDGQDIKAGCGQLKREYVI